MNNQPVKPIAILGAGSWGTALALYLARRDQEVKIWSIEASEIQAMVTEKANNRYLPGHAFPEQIKPLTDLAETVKDVEDILIVVPSAGFRQTLTSLKPLLKPNMRIICATKGLDENTGQLLNEVVEEILGTTVPYAVLSGPSFAREVAAGLPAAVVIASKQKTFLQDLTQRFNSPIFTIHPSDDPKGVEVGGVVKNVIAIATGISDGLELGANARSAIMTYGLNEIIALGTALGGKQETFIGLSGLGDLILTCSDNQSRNRRFGLAVGKSRDIKTAEKEIGQVVEGKRNAEIVGILAKKQGIKLPLCETVIQILQGQKHPKEGILAALAEFK